MTNVAMLQTAADLSASITAQGVSSLVPAGVVMAFAGATAPTGWLLCNGSAISRSTYADLFTAIGIAHGYGDNSTTFNLPDYRGRFIRGRDGAVARDPNAATRTAANTGGNTGDNVGSVQTGINSQHYHNVIVGGDYAQGSTVGYNLPLTIGSGIASGGPLGTSAAYVNTAVGSGFQAFSSGSSNIYNGIATQTSGGGAETRPLNAYVNYIIKI